MDGRGRLSQSVARSQAPRRRPAAASRGALSRSLRRFTLPISHMRVPRYTGVVAGAYVKVLVEPGNVKAMSAALAGVEGVLRLLESAPGPDAAVLDGGVPELSS